MLKTVLLGICCVALAPSVMAQEVKKVAVLDIVKDRKGDRHANKFTLQCESAGQSWSTGMLPKRTRKTFVKSHEGSLHVGAAPIPPSINSMTQGTRVKDYITLSAGQQHNFGASRLLSVVCTGPSKVYVHVEWDGNSDMNKILDAIASSGG